MFRQQAKCSFCHRNQSDVRKLVSGGRVYICDECIAEAHRIVVASGDAPPRLVRRTRPRARDVLRKMFRLRRRHPASEHKLLYPSSGPLQFPG